MPRDGLVGGDPEHCASARRWRSELMEISMRNLMLMVGAAAIALAAPLAAQGRGEGKGGHGQGHGAEQRDRGEGKGQAGNRGRGAERGERAARPDRGPRGREARAERGNRGQGNADRRVERDVRRAERDVRRAERDVRRTGRRGREVRTVEIVEPGPVVRFRNARGRGLINGGPPGLARRNNGCLPPGIARQLIAERAWYSGLWNMPAGGLYRARDGYLYQLRPNGTVAGFVPLAGGALWPGNPWPANYAYDPLPDSYRSYYGYDDPYRYRYADGIVYGLDPQTETIRQISGLLTGDTWSIGQAMPAGYGVYNVPHAYRDTYYDTPDAYYRYSDGYVYRVDPTTQLVQAAIQLLG